MKKIISLVCVIAMLFAFAVTANAATASGALVATASANEVTVGDEFTVTIKYVPGEGSAFKGGSVKLNWDYAVASYVSEDGMTDLSNNEGNINTSKNIYVVKHTSTSNDAEVWPTLTEEAVFSVVTFKAEAAGTFELTSTGTNVTFATPDNTVRQAVKEFNTVTVTIKEDAPAFTPETVKGEVVEGDDANIVLPKSEGSANTHTYTNVATFKATLGAAVNYSEAGFIWVANDVESANKFVATDDEAVSGEGTFEYGVVMAGIPAGVDIDAIPYYVTAE